MIDTVLVTNVLMVILKKQFPDWQRKAWAPSAIGLVTAPLDTMATGQITSLPTLTAWLHSGLAAGATASSARDVAVGK